VSSKPIIAVTMGDPAGVGPELCLRALGDPAVLDAAIPLVFGDAGVLRRVAEACDLAAPGAVIDRAAWDAGAAPGEAAVVDVGAIEAAAVRPGVVAAACGRAALAYVEAAIRAALDRRAAAVATAPLHKEALRAAGIPHPGHTEIFAERTGARRVCMMYASETMAVSFVTAHAGYADVPALLTVERVLDVVLLTADAVGRLRKTAPRLAVCGLNPHAGEYGLFGNGEEERVIAPAVEAARERGLVVEGPVSPDVAFLPERLQRADAVVCMYHDQGSIPFKMRCFDTGVNLTLGLPIVRASVDHGTAFDIAWQGRARVSSLRAAIAMAVRLTGAS
jgi:4-hydroxythreonine-4-phosphate dehydrogenase